MYCGMTSALQLVESIVASEKRNGADTLSVGELGENAVSHALSRSSICPIDAPHTLPVTLNTRPER